MKIPFIVSMITLTVIVLLLCIIARQDNIASGGEKNRGYLAFNRAAPESATSIMQFWKAREERISAIKTLGLLDYALMLVYCSYLIISMLYQRRKDDRRWLKFWLTIGLGTIIIGTAIDAFQDWKIHHFLTTEDPVTDMRVYTKVKWIALLTGILPFLLAISPRDLFSSQFVGRALRYISQLLKSLWLFFPGILFLLFPIFCFWMLGQGKDIITAFIKNEARTYTALSFNYTRIIFFVAIGFWVYVSWYSSRIISYIKKNRQQQDMQDITHTDRDTSERAYTQDHKFFEIGEDFLNEFPRMIGNGCFLVLELAVLQSPVINGPISDSTAWLFFFLTLFNLRYLNKWISDTQVHKPSFRKVFRALLVIFLITIVAISFSESNIWVLFVLLLFLHVIFIYYINLRRVMMEEDAPSKSEVKTGKARGLLEKLMDYFCIPRKESGYYKWFLIICAAGIALYSMGIFWLRFARGLGPFPFIILAFGVLLAFGNFVAAFSVRYKVNFHFLLLILGFMLGLNETHHTRTVKLENRGNGYSEKPDLQKYLTAWLKERSDSNTATYDMYFVMANGGASRSGYWTAAVLGNIEDASLTDTLPGRFSDKIFCLSGTSGGGVGVATFFSLLRNKQENTKPVYAASGQAFLKQDYFTYTVARMLGPDYFNYIFHIPFVEDRAGALESSFEESARIKPEGLYQVPFYENFSTFPAMAGDKTYLPVLFVNTTRMQDGNPGVVTNLRMSPDIFNTRIDVVNLLDKNKDISITTGAILGARFPYLSPAGRIADSYFVDGGYFDNSGAGVVQEIIRGIINIGKQDSMLNKEIRKINFKILHIVNSPVGFETASIKEVAPIKNDLMSPILTIAGAYDMQTTVNDGRLVNFINDIALDTIYKANYTQISLYLTPPEWKRDTIYRSGGSEPGYAMNWFISDTTLKRIDNRLRNNLTLQAVIKAMK